MKHIKNVSERMSAVSNARPKWKKELSQHKGNVTKKLERELNGPKGPKPPKQLRKIGYIDEG